MHVFLHPAVAPAVEGAKAVEPSNSAANFSHAMKAASQASQTQSLQDAGARDSEKKQHKKLENAQDSLKSASSDQGASGVQPVLSPLAEQAKPVLLMQTANDLGDEQTKETDGAASGTISSLGLRPVRVANPILSTGQGGTDVTPPATGEDDTAPPVDQGSGPTSGAILAVSDQTSTPLTGDDPASIGSTNRLKGTPFKDSPGQDVSAVKDQSVLGQGDATPTASPVTLPPVVAAPIQLAPVDAGGLDLNAAVMSGKPAIMGVDGRESSAKPVSSMGKDRATADVHGHRKNDDADGDSQSGLAGVTAPVKFTMVSATTSGQGNSGQSDDKKFQPGQIAQPASAALTNESAIAVSALNAPAQPAPTTSPEMAEAVASPTLSGARLIQSMHQSEMKLGMNSAEFGNISISTSVTHQALSAQISLDHSELGRALAAHLPAMEEKLSNAYGLQARVEVTDGANGSYASSSQHSNTDRQEQQGGSARSAKHSSALVPVVARSTSSSGLESSRLDIRI